MTSTLRKALSFLALAAIAISLSLPGSAVALFVRLAVMVVAVYSIQHGVKLYRPHRSLKSHIVHAEPWVLLGASVMLQGISDGVRFLLPDTHEISDVARAIIALAVFLTAAYALIDMLRQRFGDRARDHYSEALILSGTVSMCMWVTVFEPVLRSHSVHIEAGLSGAITVTMALMLASLSLHLLTSFEIQQPSFTALAVGQIVPVIAALVSFLGQYSANTTMRQLAIALPTVAVAFIAGAALEPSMALYEEPSGPAGARLGRLRLANLIVPIVIGPLVLTLCLTKALSLSPMAIATFTIGLSLLVVGHLISMVQARASSSHWASHDKLTGLPNRALFRERTAQALERARKMNHSVSIIYLDLDRFKNINDSMGHEVGDQLLEQVAKRILSCVDASDTVARLGGDEFAILLPGVEGDLIPRQLARRLLKKFADPFNLRPRPVFMSPSLGLAVSEGNVSLETLLTQADTAMYRAKESGRNNFAVWSQEMNEASKQRLMLETHLHSAITNDELRLVYQPKVELATGRVVGVEALIRWHHPKLGVISPGVFIHLAEESGLINQIGEWVLVTACTQARAWNDNGFGNLTMAVNLSSRQFQHGSVAELVAHTLRTTGLAPPLLELELTESVAMSGSDATLSTLQDLRSMGVKCSIDDFGTGYSNLSYLSRFPIDTLKIDKSFVEQIDKSGGDAAIVVAIIAMAHGLHLNVIAEGVETPEQASFLAAHDCDEMQGFLFSRPLPPNELEGLLMLEQVASGQGRLGITQNVSQPRRLERPMPPHERVRPPAAANEEPVRANHFRVS